MNWSEFDKSAVWNKGQVVFGYDPDRWRKDACGAWMNRLLFGDRNAPYGWEIDHIVPVVKGGTDHGWNLQPLHWANNAAKGDGPLACAVTASGVDNVPVSRTTWVR